MRRDCVTFGLAPGTNIKERWFPVSSAVDSQLRLSRLNAINVKPRAALLVLRLPNWSGHYENVCENSKFDKRRPQS
jgi:hypothetical protein